MYYLANVPLSGPDGSTTITDLAGSSWVVNGNAQIQSNALLLDGSDDFVRTGGGNFALGSGPIEIGIDVKTTQSGDRALVDDASSRAARGVSRRRPVILLVDRYVMGGSTMAYPVWPGSVTITLMV